MKCFSLSLTSLATAIAWFGFVTGPLADPAEAAVTTTGGAFYSSSDAIWFIGHNSPGSLTIDNGSQEANGTQGAIGVFTPGTVTVTGPGSLWQFQRAGVHGWEGLLRVGDYDSSGTLNIENGGRVNLVKEATIGYRGGTQGTATVTGANSTWDVGDYLSVGDGRSSSESGSTTGLLTIVDGGHVNSNTAYVGRYGIATGTVTVTGTNSIWDSDGYFYVGKAGTGTLTIEDGGRVENTNSYTASEAGSNGTVTVTGANSIWDNSGSLYVGRYGTGTLTIEDGGRVENTDSYTASVAGSDGTVTVTGTNSIWDNSGSLYVGRYGTGTLTIEDGGRVENTAGYIGIYSGASGTVEVKGTGSTWKNESELHIGGLDTNVGSADVSIQGGGTLSVTGDTKLYSGSTLTLTGAASTLELGGTFITDGTLNFNDGALRLQGQDASWDPGSFTLAPAAAAILELTGGASISNIDSSGSHMTVEDGGSVLVASGSSLTARHQYRIDDGGSTVVDGANSTLTVADAEPNYSGRIYVGYTSGGRGTMTVSDGADLTADKTLHIGYYSSDNQGAGVSGADALQIDVDGDGLVDGSQLTITGSGSTVVAPHTLVSAAGTNARLYVEDGGSLTTDNLTVSTWLSIDEGGASSSGSGDGGYVKVAGAGSLVTVNDEMGVGSAGYNARLAVLDGGRVSSGGNLHVGELASSTGNSVRVSGSSGDISSTLVVGGDLAVGGTASNSGGHGNVSVEDGGTLSVTGNTTIYSGSTLTLTGAASTLELDGSFTNTGTFDWQSGGVKLSGASASWDKESSNFTLGNTTTQSLTLEEGAELHNERGYVGPSSSSSGGSGTATISGPGSTWDNSSYFYVGRYGTGAVTIEDGGRVENTNSYTASEAGSDGTVTVTGANSIWDNSGSLYVGRYGTGAVTIENGGRVENTAGYIGIYSGASGTVEVKGTGSTWENDGDLYIGGWSTHRGSADVLIQGGGTLAVTGDTKVYSGSTISLNGGTLRTSTLSAMDGTIADKLQFNSGELNFTGPGGLVVDTNGPLGALVAVESSQTLRVDHTTTIPTGGLLSVDGGTLHTSAILRTEGVLQLNSGELNLTGPGGLVVEASGPLGGSITVEDGQTLRVDHATAIPTGGSLSVGGGALITSVLQIDGGSFAAPDLSGVNDLQFNSGELNFTGLGGLVVDTNGPLGALVAVESSQTLRVDHTTTILVGGSLSVSDGSLITSSLEIDGGSLNAADLSGVDHLIFNSGELNVTGPSGLVVDPTGPLGSLTLHADDRLDVAQRLNIASGGTVQLSGGSLIASVLEVDGGLFIAPDLSGVNDLQFNSGELNFTGPGGLVLDANGFMGASVVVENNQTLRVDHTTTIPVGGLLSVDGGTLHTSAIFRTEGVLQLNSGELNLTGPGGLVVEASGPLGASITVEGGQTLRVDHTTAIRPDSSLSVSGGSLITSVLQIDGGSFAAPDLSGVDHLTFNSGELNLTGPGGLVVDTNGPLGALVAVESSQTLRVDHTTAIPTGGLLSVDGGTLRTSALAMTGGTLQLNSGELNLTGPGGLVVEASGPLGASITVEGGQTLRVDHTTAIRPDSSLSVSGGSLITSVLQIDGGSFAAPDLLGVNDLQFNSGELNITGPGGLVVDSNGPLSSLVLQTGDRLDVAQTLAITSGGTVQVSGGILQYDRLAVQEAGSLNFGDTGLYLLGRTTDNTVISLAGTLGVGSANVSLVDADGVDLGSSTTLAGGTLTSATGFSLDGDDEISGHGRLFGDLTLGTNGTVAGSGNGLELFGHVSGSGNITGSTVYGNLVIGTSPGTITLEDSILSDATTTVFEVGGTDVTSFDQLLLAGSVTLNGTADIRFTDGFTPEASDTFQLIDLGTATLTNWFRQVTVPDGWGVSETGQLYTIIVPAPEDADFDDDNLVDGIDFLTWQRGVGGVGTPSTGDANEDALVNNDDLTIWQNQYGGPPIVAGSVGTVPEPSSALILALGLAGLLPTRRLGNRSRRFPLFSRP